MHNEKLDWVKAYTSILEKEHLEADAAGVPDSSPGKIVTEMERMKHIQSQLKQVDGFVPASLGDLTDDEVLELMNLSRKIYEKEYPNLPFLVYYREAIEKMVILAMEQNEALFGSVDPGIQRRICNWKMEMPTENELYLRTYAYILGHFESPHLYPGQDFAALLDELSNNLKLKAKIKRVYAEYIMHFKARKPAGN